MTVPIKKARLMMCVCVGGGRWVMQMIFILNTKLSATM